MESTEELKVWILALSGEIVRAKTFRDAKIEFIKFGYTQKELQTIMTEQEYMAGGLYKLPWELRLP